ncbi:cytochrome P450 6B2-like isoform X2 [Cydia fagiglandana]|uniref:cytochrome P450 6B2-like isoform X2 n=1 Tax=Cydia fagiglandana TaxID=1458189 RepID=UPI002FEDF050
MFLTVAIVAVIVILLFMNLHKYNYWTIRGVKHEKCIPLFGTIFRVITQQICLSEYVAELYYKYPKEQLVGFSICGMNALVVRDPELIKQVLTTDFQHFYPRALNPNKRFIEPMLKNLFFADGDLWKLLRQRMTPAFTSGKLKAMFPLIVERTKRLQRSAAAKLGSEVDVRDLMARYTTDFIGACGFGIDCDSINDDTSIFRQLGKSIFNPSKKQFIICALKWVFPEKFKHFRLLPLNIEQTTLALVKGIMMKRNYKPSGRNDFIDLLLELKAKGTIVGESLESRNHDGSQTAQLEMDEVLMAAQVFVFFAAGFETSSSATSYTLHQLALNPDKQTKCQQEIDHVLARYDGKLCFDAVKEMKYLEMCFKEGMRMLPSLGFLIRQCVRPYTFPGTDVTIDAGVYVLVSVQGLHNDEQYFDDPAQFRPERFSEGASIPKHVYLPFGEGPRACIGERLGLMQSLAGLAALLRRCSVAPSAGTRAPRVDPASFIVQNIDGGLPLSLVPREIQSDVHVK